MQLKLQLKDFSETHYSVNKKRSHTEYSEMRGPLWKGITG